MVDLITFLYSNRKLSICTGEHINGIYRDLEIIITPTNLTSSDHRYHNFGASSSTKNNT